MLDDALSLMQHGVVAEQRPDPAALTSARSAVRSFMDDTMQASSIKPAPDAPPPPSLEPLRAQGIRTVDDGTFLAAVSRLEDRRRTQLGLVRGDGWTWED